MRRVCTFRRPFLGHLLMAEDGRNNPFRLSYDGEVWELSETGLIDMLALILQREQSLHRNEKITFEADKGNITVSRTFFPGGDDSELPFLMNHFIEAFT